jgi:glutathione reductase (NADPH)
VSYDFDLFVIGGGSGGVRAARMSASYGGRVGLCEDTYFGGTCVNAGCVPKKLLVYGAHFHEDFEDAEAYGWTVGERRFDWQMLRAAKDKEIGRLNGVYRRLLDNAGVTVLEGRGVLLDHHTIEVAGKRVTAENILIAVGGRPLVPAIPGAELGVTSDHMFHLEELPRRAVVIGGGYIGLEFAGVLRGLGAEVTIVHRGDKLLRGFDEDVRDFVGKELTKKGIDVRLDAALARMARTDTGLTCHLESGHVLEGDLVLFATGRVPRTQGIGLEEIGVELDRRGGVVVDEYFRSSVPNIYAVGDVIHRVQLTPVALAEGTAVARALFLGEERPVSYENIATAVFSQPPVATVGLTEEQARVDYEVLVFKSEFTPLKHTLTGRDERTLMKMIVDKQSDRVLGVHIVGADAAEMCQGFAVALTCRATKAQLDATVGIHPTSAEELVTMRTPVG